MNKQTYDKVVKQLTEDRKQVAKGKRRDYTKQSSNVLKNFHNQAEALGVDPKVSLAVHMEKQFSAVLNFVKTDGKSESEPIIKRIGDCINYLELLWGLIQEERQELEDLEPIEDSYPATPKESTSVPIEYDEGYIVDQIREYEEGYEVCSGDKCARFKNGKIKGAYFNRMGTPKKLEVDDGRVYKIETDANVESVCLDDEEIYVKRIKLSTLNEPTGKFIITFQNNSKITIPENDVIKGEQSHNNPYEFDWIETDDKKYVVEELESTGRSTGI